MDIIVLFFFSKIEIPPDERALDKADNSRRVGNQSSRNTGANNNGQSLQKLCMRIQKETSKI